MEKLKVLNLYAGIGGNRKLWGGDIEVTAVELNPEIAAIYKDLFPKDNVIIADAHKYLLEHYSEYDFIWASPPCPTHSRTNHYLNRQGIRRYPDMKLYQEIILLKTFFKGKWVVENVISYYEPMIKPHIAGRHYFWSNFFIPFKEEKSNFNITNARTTSRKGSKEFLMSLEKYHGISLSKYKLSGEKKRLFLHNCVNPALGRFVFDMAFRERQLRINEIV